MPQAAYVEPTNQVAVTTEGLEAREYEVGANATAAQMVPRRLVITDTIDTDVKEAGAAADNVLGVIDVAPGGLITTAYAVGDQVRIIKKGVVTLILVSGSGAVAPGSPIVSAANGKAALQAVAAMGSQGSVVARALETEDPSAADKICVCELLLTSEPAAAT